MSKQSDWFEGLSGVSDRQAEETSTPSPAPAAKPALMRRNILASREDSVSRLMDGSTKQVVERQIDPEEIVVWSGNPRDQDLLEKDDFLDLIESIQAHGQLEPGLARRIAGTKNLELVTGSRRLAAVRWLKANGYPDIKYLVQIRDVSNEEAFRRADEENRTRSDVSPIERARSYAYAIEDLYNGDLTTLATKLGISKGFASKHLKVAAIPEEIWRAVPRIKEVSLIAAYTLAQKLDDPNMAKLIKANAKAIAADIEAGAQFATDAALKKLTEVSTPSSKPEKFEVLSKTKRPMLNVQSATKGGMTMKLHSNSGASEEELIEGFRGALRHHGMLN